MRIGKVKGKYFFLESYISILNILYGRGIELYRMLKFFERKSEG